MLKRLAGFIGQYKKYFILSPVLVVFESVAELLLPMMMGEIVDRGINTQSYTYIYLVGSAMVLVSAVGLVSGVLSARYSAKASQGFGYNVRKAIFDKIQTFSFADIDQFSTASLVTRTTTDVKRMQETAMQIVRVLVRAPSLLIASLTICLLQNWKLSMIFFVAIPALLFVVLMVMKFTRHLFLLLQTKFDNLNAAVQENLIAIRVVKTFVRTDYEKQKFKKSNDDLTNTAMSALKRIMVMNPCTTFVLNATTLTLYFIGGRMCGNEALLSGELMSFISYLNNILMSVMMFSMVLTQMTQARASAERVVEVLDHKPDIEGAMEGSERRLKGEITFDHVSFRYPQSDRKGMVLNDLSFTIKAGSFVAIVGATGVGKTTMVSLIPRFYDPTQGRVLVDGKDVRDYDLQHLRENIGMVLQNNVLFSGTIRDNLQWGAPGGNDGTLLEAAKDSQAYEFISRFPEGLDTEIDQGGVNVSGGQKQRLCIGRAMLKNPSILILDDSTSAVDSATEGKIRETFYNKYKNTTVLLIAQRISSVQYADQIIVLDKGQLNDMGTHEELMQRCQVYRDIYDSQQEGDTLDDGE